METCTFRKVGSNVQEVQEKWLAMNTEETLQLPSRARAAGPAWAKGGDSQLSQHWNAFEGKAQATQTPVGTCFVATEGLRHFAEYAPCRCHNMEATYQKKNYTKDKRYCEVGFSATITHVRLIYSVNLSAVVSPFPGSALLWSVALQQVTEDMYGDYDDAYRGYSVAMGEFDGDPATPGRGFALGLSLIGARGGVGALPWRLSTLCPQGRGDSCVSFAEYVVGVPNKRTTWGVVEIFSARKSLVLVQSIQSEQVASYFGHTVAVADVNGDGKDDILVGSRSDRKLYEGGRIYLYLQHQGPHPSKHPWQTMTGTQVQPSLLRGTWTRTATSVTPSHPRPPAVSLLVLRAGGSGLAQRHPPPQDMRLAGSGTGHLGGVP
ncbi:Integrin alpha-IIb [Platysternon megacephalum]|uniref:Integrin alpha-IIb n=1 Tax=Platysternon megacephalum TaxID=55544 RepID=A0A4D9E4X4_9SAUR|nr:Integrin alpha-IIb [Platysternon megacephalum]